MKRIVAVALLTALLAGCVTTQHVLKAPKWGKVRNTIYPKVLQEVLEPHREPDGFVFQVDGLPIGYDRLANALNRACARAGVRFTMHQLRHSLQTALRGSGVPDDLIRAMFGWSSSAVQDNYTHRELYDLKMIEDKM